MPSRRRAVCVDITNTLYSSSAITTDHRLVERVTFDPLSGCGEQIGLVSVEFRRVPASLILPGWPIFETADGAIQVGLPQVLGPYPGSRHTGISSPELPQLITEVRTAVLAWHPDLTDRS